MITIPDEVIALFKSDNAYKNFRVHFPGGERADIINNNIVSESVSFTESICSQNTLKFGLCESPVIQFEVVGIENIKGSTIECSLEIECHQSVTGAEYKSDIDKYVYSIPYGTFAVDSCPRQADMSHRKVTAYQVASQVSWSFPEELKTTLSMTSWFKPNDFKIAIEVFFKIMGLYPKSYVSEVYYDEYAHIPIPYNEYRQIDPSRPGEVWLVRFEADVRRYKIYNWGDDSLILIRSVYDPAYLQKLRDMTAYLEEVGRRPMGSGYASTEVTVCSLFESSLQYEAPGVTARNNAVYCTYFYEKVFYPANTEHITAEIFKQEDDGNDRYTMSLGSVMTSGSPIPVYWHVPIRVRAYVTNGNDEKIYIYDTGNFNNYLERDTNDVPFSTSANNIYFIPNTNSVSTVFNKVGGGTLTKTVYKNNWNQLETLDIKQFIQDNIEVMGKFGRFNRDGSFSLFSVEDADDYHMSKSEYESLWYDEAYVKKIGRIVCNYTSNGIDNSVIHPVASLYNDTVYKIYTISNNTYLDTGNFTEQQVETMLSAMADNIDDIEYIPAQVKTKGLPWIEAGDYLIIETAHDGDIRVLVERHTLSGIQFLRDSIECRDEAMETTTLSVLYDPVSEMLIIGG